MIQQCSALSERANTGAWPVFIKACPCKVVALHGSIAEIPGVATIGLPVGGKIPPEKLWVIPKEFSAICYKSSRSLFA
uniref:Serine acetyltransferase n=1 Tax=Steinernema glaseri TaxID=37863 RepID=A0A1I7ZEC6_9BILA